MIKFDSLNEFENVLFTSDLHYGHKNICRGTSTWDLKAHGGHNSVRDFETLEAMNQAIVDGINIMAGEDDVIVNNGDVAFGGKGNIPELLDRLICKNTVLCFGNHDHNIRNKEMQALFENVLPANDSQYIQVKGQKIYCSHYPTIVYHQAHKGALHAYGHVHNNYDGSGKSLDVGIDSAFAKYGSYRPFTFKEFIEWCNKREYVQLSHHNSQTS